MYVDKLDGRIDASFFDRMSAEWRVGQSRLLRSIQDHESTSTAYEADAVRLLELQSLFTLTAEPLCYFRGSAYVFCRFTSWSRTQFEDKGHGDVLRAVFQTNRECPRPGDVSRTHPSADGSGASGRAKLRSAKASERTPSAAK